MKAGTLTHGVALTFYQCFLKVSTKNQSMIPEIPLTTNLFLVPGSRGNVFTHTYSSEIEEFTGHDAYKLDEWVFEQFERFVDIAAHNQTLTEMLNQNGIVFFFHLLGLDTNGHVNKPDST